jgi:hypothetical protein
VALNPEGHRQSRLAGVPSYDANLPSGADKSFILIAATRADEAIEEAIARTPSISGSLKGMCSSILFRSQRGVIGRRTERASEQKRICSDAHKT